MPGILAKRDSISLRLKGAAALTNSGSSSEANVELPPARALPISFDSNTLNGTTRADQDQSNNATKTVFFMEFAQERFERLRYDSPNTESQWIKTRKQMIPENGVNPVPKFITPSFAQERHEKVYYGGRMGFEKPINRIA